MGLFKTFPLTVSEREYFQAKPTKRAKGVCAPTCLAPRRGCFYKLFIGSLTFCSEMAAYFQRWYALSGDPAYCFTPVHEHSAKEML